MADFCSECNAAYEELNKEGRCWSCELDEKSLAKVDYDYEQYKYEEGVSDR